MVQFGDHFWPRGHLRSGSFAALYCVVSLGRLTIRFFFGSGPGFVSRTQSDPGFVNPVRSGPGFVNPIRSDPSRPGFVNTPFLAVCLKHQRIHLREAVGALVKKKESRQSMTARGYCCYYLEHCSETNHIAITMALKRAKHENVFGLVAY